MGPNRLRPATPDHDPATTGQPRLRGEGVAERPAIHPGARTFARAWAAAIAGTSYLPMAHARLEELLEGFTLRLQRCLEYGDPQLADAWQVGADLVAAHITAAEAIGRTVQLLDTRLLDDLQRPADRLRPRLPELLGAVTAGFARALRDRTLEEQDAIRRAALLAQREAEAALRDSEARFRYQATHDPLTDLANRTLFTDRLAALFAPDPSNRRRRLAVCFADLDGFKVINDTLGHHVGDLLLITIADRLRQRVPEHLIARLGGDEFVILLEQPTSTDEAIKVADSVLAAVSEPAVIDGHELIVSASIGIVDREVAGTGPGEVMRAADITLQWAKSAGKGRWALFDPERNERHLARYALSAAMPAAVDHGEFFVEYQPLVSLTDHRLLGAEALVRWRHPNLGVLYPDSFIGLAEESGLILRLGGRVLREACRQAKVWETLSPDPPYVSVNLAARQARDPGLYDRVVAQLTECDLAPSRLQLEITESAVIGPDREPVEALHRLADLGVRIAIDDFGTGYSNLAYLRRLPVREIKLAGMFLDGLQQPPPAARRIDERILAALVSLAHMLDLTVTAEQVETADQARRLRELGCDAGQGWHFGAPTSPARFRQLLSGSAGQ